MRFPFVAFFAGLVMLAVLSGCKRAPVSAGGVVTWKDVTVGSDPRVVEPGDTLWVQYRGTLQNKKVFEQNMSEDKDVLCFTQGGGEVIKGWDEGVLGMHPGGERMVHIPAKFAYGEEGRGPVPSNADIDFDIKLLGLVKIGEEKVVDHTETKPGTGDRVVKDGDTVTIKYKGVLLNGKSFTGSDPKTETFKVGKGDVLSCLDAGVKGMKVGGVRKLIAPPSVAFANQAAAGVPANSLVNFEIEVVSIK